MKVRVHSHEGAAVLHPRRYEAYSAAMIRMTTMPQFVPLVFRDAYLDVLELRFADVTPEGFAHIIENEKDLVDKQLADGHAMWLMTTDHAKQINEFVDRVKDKIELLVVHCDAGVSRSSAVAIELCVKLGLTEELDTLQANKRFHPNYYVRDLIREQWSCTSAERQRLYEKLFIDTEGC